MDSFMPHFETLNGHPNIPSSSNATGLFPPMTLVPHEFETQEFQVEKLQMGDLMKNPFVQGLVTTVMDNGAYQKKLFQQMNALQAEVVTLKEELSQKETRHDISGRSFRRIPSGSISPSDSVSQMATSKPTSSSQAGQGPYRIGQATRPAEYPESIIWNFEDCKRYPGIVTEANLSRPAMEKCIRHEDGAVISSAEWRAIKTSARMLVNVYLITLKPPADPSAKTRTKTKTYYAKYFPQIWSDVLEKLEYNQPLVRLCASHWKAEHIIGNCLQAIIEEERKKKKSSAQVSNDGNSEDEEPDVEPAARAQKRGPEEPQEFAGKRKKQKTKKGTIGVSMRIDKDLTSNPLPAISTAAASSSTSLEHQLSNLGSADDIERHGHLANIVGASTNTVDVSFIYVDTKCSSLKNELAEGFPFIENASDLLDSMAAYPEFGGGKPSEKLLAFLTRIDTADPNSTEFSEDDTNASWGHSQFTAGNLTWSAVLTSWNDIGNCRVACQLLAAAIKTCKVARHLCFERQITAGSYLSDVYLEQIVDALWKIWKDAGGPVLKGKRKENQVAHQTDNPNPDSNESPQDVVPRPADDTTTTDQPDSDELTRLDEDSVAKVRKELEKLLQSKNILKDELKTWIKVNNVAFTWTNKQPTKQDLISAILKDSRCLTQPAAIRQEFQKMLDERKESKKASSKNAA